MSILSKITNPCSQSPVVSLAIRQRSRDLFTPYPQKRAYQKPRLAYIISFDKDQKEEVNIKLVLFLFLFLFYFSSLILFLCILLYLDRHTKNVLALKGENFINQLKLLFCARLDKICICLSKVKNFLSFSLFFFPFEW